VSRDYESESAFKSRPCLPGTGVKAFVVTGTQRTGTNILREILNTNNGIAMVAEILTPCPPPGQMILDQAQVSRNFGDPYNYNFPETATVAPRPGLNYRGHWGNFLRELSPGRFPAANPGDAEALLDQYFEFLLDQIRHHWAYADKSACRAIGVDIKYSHLRHLAPIDWRGDAPPFLLEYFRSRGVTLIHAIRQNVIHCAISALMVRHVQACHNYEGIVIDHGYEIDSDECLTYARNIVKARREFLQHVAGFAVVECHYEDLLLDIARSGPEGEIADGRGPLRDIADALGVPFGFRYDGRLRKSIAVPYSRLLSNRDALVRALEQSEFSAFAVSLA
jgi:hypothetical protein